MPRHDRELAADLAIERAACQWICGECGVESWEYRRFNSTEDIRLPSCRCDTFWFRLETPEEAAARFAEECDSDDVRDYLNHERNRRP